MNTTTQFQDSALEFDQESHIYRLDSRVIPSVTQVLPKGGLEFVSPDILELAAMEGKRNHKILESLVNQENPQCETLHDMEMAEVLEDFLQHETPGKIIGSEIQMVSRKSRFAGTTDVLFEMGITDLKRSSGDPKLRALQLAGYWILAIENGLINPKLLKGRKPMWWILTVESGKYKLRNVYNPLAESVFLSLVRAEHARVNFENYMKVV